MLIIVNQNLGLWWWNTLYLEVMHNNGPLFLSWKLKGCEQKWQALLPDLSDIISLIWIFYLFLYWIQKDPRIWKSWFWIETCNFEREMETLGSKSLHMIEGHSWMVLAFAEACEGDNSSGVKSRKGDVYSSKVAFTARWFSCCCYGWVCLWNAGRHR